MIRVIEKVNELSSDAFFDKHDIVICDDNNSIGFSEKEQAWYGFSHRAIHGFKVGDKCKGDIGLGDGYSFKSGDILKTLDDCKQRAIDYAKAVD